MPEAEDKKIVIDPKTGQPTLVSPSDMAAGQTIQPQPEKKSFLRNLLTNYLQTLGEDLSSGVTTEGIGQGILAGTRRGGTPGQAFGATLASIPEARRSRQVIQFQNALRALQQQNVQSQIQNRDLQAENAAQKLRQQKETQEMKNEIDLMKQGKRRNAKTGTIEDIPDDELPAPLKDKIARTRELQKINEERIKYMQARIDAMKTPSDTKAQELAIRAGNLAARMRALGLQEEALKLQQEKFQWAKDNPSPTAKGAADQGKAILDIAGRLKTFIKSHPQDFGPLAGRIVNFEAGLGTIEGPESQFYTELQSFYSAQGKLHGWRAIRTKEEFQKAINALARNPEAALASIEAVENTARSFIKAGSRPEKKEGGGFNKPVL